MIKSETRQMQLARLGWRLFRSSYKTCDHGGHGDAIGFALRRILSGVFEVLNSKFYFGLESIGARRIRRLGLA